MAAPAIRPLRANRNRQSGAWGSTPIGVDRPSSRLVVRLQGEIKILHESITLCINNVREVIRECSSLTTWVEPVLDNGITIVANSSYENGLHSGSPTTSTITVVEEWPDLLRFLDVRLRAWSSKISQIRIEESYNDGRDNLARAMRPLINYYGEQIKLLEQQLGKYQEMCEQLATHDENVANFYHGLKREDGQ